MQSFQQATKLFKHTFYNKDKVKFKFFLYSISNVNCSLTNTYLRAREQNYNLAFKILYSI